MPHVWESPSPIRKSRRLIELYLAIVADSAADILWSITVEPCSDSLG